MTAEDEGFADFIFGHPERAGAVGLSEPVLGVGFNVLFVQDKGRGVGKFGQEERLGPVDGNLDGPLVDNLHPGYLQGVSGDLRLHPDYISQILVNVWGFS